MVDKIPEASYPPATVNQKKVRLLYFYQQFYISTVTMTWPKMCISLHLVTFLEMLVITFVVTTLFKKVTTVGAA